MPGWSEWSLAKIQSPQIIKWGCQLTGFWGLGLRFGFGNILPKLLVRIDFGWLAEDFISIPSCLIVIPFLLSSGPGPGQVRVRRESGRSESG